MKKLNIIYGLLAFVFLVSMCSCKRREQKAFTILCFNHNLEYTSIDCDSVNMVYKNHAEYYINGHKMNVYAEGISVKSNK